VLNNGLAKKYGGKFNLRFDDTNPSKEEQEYVDSIIRDVRWLGGEFEDRIFYASEYFEKMYAFAVQLIEAHKAYVCDLTPDQMREYKGNYDTPGRPSPFRDRTVAENLDLFARMRKGEFGNGEKTLRAKIDVNAGNMNLRDPVMYRILHETHQHVKDAWCIYPSYDWAHGLEDTIEGITHSICTLEFKDHRPLYDWFLDALNFRVGERPRQTEFARLNVTHVVLSKRKLIQLVEEKHVNGWDDPLLPTLSGLRRRGVSPTALHRFCETIGVTEVDSVIDCQRLENAIREDLDVWAQRRMVVLDPVKLVIENFAEGETELLELENHPKDAKQGKRSVPFSKTLFIEREDFMEVPAKGFFRLSPGVEVRLRGAYFVKCESVVKDAQGVVQEIRCSYDPLTKSGMPVERKVKGTIHWVSAAQSIGAELRFVDRLFTVEDPDRAATKANKTAYKEIKAGAVTAKSFLDYLNPKSLTVSRQARLEPACALAKTGDALQFERHAFFRVDEDSRPGALVFVQTVSLKDSWAKEQRKA
jgi:glutaminyl-tRNA synthetase